MSAFLSELGYAVRRLAASPGFTLATLASIGLGVGVNVAVFTLANDLLLKPLEVPRAGELVRVYNGHHSPLTGHELTRVQAMTSFSAVFGERSYGATMTVGGSEPERVQASLASDNLFQGLEVIPAAGRLFTTGGETGEVVLSHEFWLRRFGADRAIIGQGLRINERNFTVIGVAPPGRSSAQMGWWSDVVMPTRDAVALAGVPLDSIQGSFYTTARLAPRVTAAMADAEVALLAAQLSQADTTQRAIAFRTRPARGITEEVRLTAGAAMAFLGAIALLVLLMAATNVGNLMLARNAARQRELGVRTALGASRARLVLLLLSEAILLAVAAGAVAWLLAAWGVAFLPRLIPDGVEMRLAFAADWRVLWSTIFASGLAVILFGLIPARVALRRDVVSGIKEGSAIGHGTDGARVRRRFLTVQVAICALLLATGSLFVRSLARAGMIDPGFQREGVVVATIDLDGRAMSNETRRAYFARLLAAVRELPGVAVATWSRIPELTGSNSETTFITDAGSDTARARGTYTNTVGPDYHTTLGIPLLAGRDFSVRDVADAPPVVIVNETFAAREWPGADPLAQRVSLNGREGPWMEVVGVSRNVKYHTLGEGPKPFLVLPVAQDAATNLTLEARVVQGASPVEVMAAIRRTARVLDPLLPPPSTQLLTDLQSITLLPARVGAGLLGGIGVLAALLATVGVGGVAAYTVSQRRREIGVRVALGATSAQVLRGVLGNTGRTVAWGAAVGLIMALVVGRLVASQLYGVSFADPVTFLVVFLLLTVLVLGAAVVPVRRALAVSPVDALRAE